MAHGVVGLVTAHGVCLLRWGESGTVNSAGLPAQSDSYQLNVTRYQRVSSMLLALVILLGVIVAMLFIIWLTGQFLLSQKAVPIELAELGEGTGPLGGGMELEAPTQEEIGEETDLIEPQIEDRLAAVADAVGTRAASLVDPTLTEHARSGRGGGSSGDGRMPGTGSGSGEGQARQWEVRFPEGNTLAAYARRLDFFGIELGVLLPDNKVVYASNLAKAKPDVRTGPADEEKRYYLTWRRGELQAADRELLAKAGIEIAAALVRARSGHVLWFAMVDGEPGSGDDPSALASAADALARAVVW